MDDRLLRDQRRNRTQNALAKISSIELLTLNIQKLIEILCQHKNPALYDQEINFASEFYFFVCTAGREDETKTTTVTYRFLPPLQRVYS